MTVKELINILKKMPQDYPVIIGYTLVNDVYIDNNFYFGDQQDLMESIGPAVIIE